MVEKEKIDWGKHKEHGIYVVINLGIVFDPETRKILIGKRKEDEHMKELTWAFPGGKAEYDEELEDAIKREVKEETSLNVESLGVVFAKTYPEKREFMAIYHLCELMEEKENAKANDDFTELKWVNPEELDDYFTTSFHPKLKEYIMGLKKKF